MIVFQMKIRKREGLQDDSVKQAERQVQQAVPVIEFEASERLQQEMKNSPIAKEVNKLVNEGKYAQANLMMLENPQTADILRQTFEKVSREAGIDENLISSGALWKYFETYIREIAGKEMIAKRAVDEFSKEMLRDKVMRRDFEQKAVNRENIEQT